MGAEFSAPQYAKKSLPVEAASAASPAMRTSKVLAFHSPARWKAHFEASKASSKLMVIDFSASWCVPCRTMEPVIEEFSAEYTDVEFIKLDVDELMGVAGQFGVQLLPTFVLVRKGIIVDKVTGVKREELQKKIEKHRSANIITPDQLIKASYLMHAPSSSLT